MIKSVLTALSIMSIIEVAAQQRSKDLTIGDTLPDITISKIISLNSIKSTEHTSKYKNKLLILDFWGTGCSPCVARLPKVDSLQKEFGTKIKIFPVTVEKEDYVLKFLKNNKYTKNLALSYIVEDRVFNGYFKHRDVSQQVWVYKNRIIGITADEYVDAYNIKKVLNGEKVNWPLKYDFYTCDFSKPLFSFDESQIDTSCNFVKYSAISDYRGKVNSGGLSGGHGIFRDSIKKTIRTYFLNQPILVSYLANWMQINKMDSLIKPYQALQPNQIVWEVTGKSKYTYQSSYGYEQDWILKNAICFESVNPDTGQTDQDVYQSVNSDLDRLLGLKVRWEKRNEKVLILIKNKEINNRNKSNNSNARKYLIGSIVYNLNNEPDNPYVFDESGDNQSEIFISLDSWKNLSGVNKQLQKFGFELKEEYKLVDKLIFTEIDGGRIIDGEMQAKAQQNKMAQANLKLPSLTENQDYLLDNKTRTGVKVTKSGLQYMVIKDGYGNIPNLNSKVLVNYEGRLVNGKIFDSSYEKGKPTEFNVKDVISGWTEALQIMTEGAKWEIYIPAALAYGSHTASGTVPPNSTLIFTIELIKILQ